MSAFENINVSAPITTPPTIAVSAPLSVPSIGAVSVPITIGAQGAQGAQGVGVQGPQGAQGAGVQGAQGAQGASVQGAQGAQGAASTVQGPQGAQGVGVQGPQGAQGAASTVQGPQGAQGASVQGPQGAQGASVQGAQGAQGAASTVQGPQGAQGAASTVQGPQGAQGADSTVQGPQGAQGAASTVQGPQGAQGSTGASAVAGKIPSAYIETSTPSGTTSAALVDVPSMSVTITLDEPVEITIHSAFEIATQSGAAPSTVAVAVNIDGTDHDEYKRYLSGSSDTGIGALTHRSDVLSAGSHTVKLRYRRVSGAATPGINRADLLVVAMQSAIGAQGAQGAASTVQGPQGNQGAASTVQGPQGAQGASVQGAQGAQGADSTVQGPQGAQGASVQGAQGAQGASVQGAQGNQGVAGVGNQSAFSVQGSQIVLSAQTVTNIFAEISVPVNSQWEYAAVIGLQPAAGTQGAQVGIQCSVAGAIVEGVVRGPQTTTSSKAYRQAAQGNGTLPIQNVAGVQSVELAGFIQAPSTGSPTIGVQVKGVQASQGWWSKPNCLLRLTRIS
jgi:collagen type I alpha